MSTLQLCRCLLDQPRFHVHRFPPALFLSQTTPIKVLPFQNQTNLSRRPPPEGYRNFLQISIMCTLLFFLLLLLNFGVMDQASELVGKKASDIDASKSPKRFCDDIIPHILNLYASRATPRDFEIYAPDATFEDPLMSAHGVMQIKSAFYSLSKVFKESSIVEYNVEENTISPGKHEILIDNKQHYKFWGRDIDMISLIKLDVEEGKVVRHEDRWDKKPLLNRETVQVPLLGRMIEVARRGSMLATHAMMGFGKDPTETQQS